jgi:hypothetical protein
VLFEEADYSVNMFSMPVAFCHQMTANYAGRAEANNMVIKLTGHDWQSLFAQKTKKKIAKNSSSGKFLIWGNLAHGHLSIFNLRLTKTSNDSLPITWRQVNEMVKLKSLI